LAVENKLLALGFGALIVFSFEVWLSNGCGLNRYFPSMFEVGNKFSQWKSSSILPYFCGGNPIVLHLRCVIAHQTLFSPSFRCENTKMGMPHFHNENPSEFRV